MIISRRFNFSHKAVVSLNETQKKAKRQVEDKIQSGIYSFESILCPICKNRSTETISKKDRYGLPHEVEICKTCGLIFTNPRMTQTSYNEFYDSEYRKLYLGAVEPQENYIEKQYKRGGEIFSWIQNLDLLDIEKANVLEIGCSSGGILAFFANKGCDVLGVDLDSKFLNYGKKKFGLNLIHGSLDDIPGDFKPDLIIYSHVLEHILDLEKELYNLKRISTPKTLFYIEVPGIKNVHSAYKGDTLLYFQNAHTFHFSLTTLNNLMSENNFDLIQGDEFIRSIFRPKIESEFKSFKNDYHSALDYLNRTEKKRYREQFHVKILKKKIGHKLVVLLQSAYRKFKKGMKAS